MATEAFSFLRNLHLMFGIPTFRKEFLSRPNFAVTFVYNCYILLVELVTWSGAFRSFSYSFVFKNATLLVQVYTAITFITQTFIRFFLICHHLRHFRRYMLSLDRLPYLAAGCKSDDFLEIFRTKYRVATNICKFLSLNHTVLCLISFVAIPLLTPDKKIELPLTYPFKDSLPYGELVYMMIDLLTIIVIIWRSLSMDLFILTILIFHASQMSYVKRMLMAVFEKINTETDKNQANSRKWMVIWVESQKEALG